eukprot:13112651-Alexandrium_andersonii.AAC.1
MRWARATGLTGSCTSSHVPCLLCVAPWAEHALRVASKQQGRARSADPPTRGTVLEIHLADQAPWSAAQRSASAS